MAFLFLKLNKYKILHDFIFPIFDSNIIQNNFFIDMEGVDYIHE